VSSYAGSVAGALTDVVLSKVKNALMDFVDKARERRATLFARGFMESDTPDETAAVLFLTELQRSPDAVKDATVAAFRMMEEALCDEVVPALGLLTRQYQRAGKSRDAFFIGAGRLLRDIGSAEELRSLFGVLVFAAHKWPTTSSGTPESVRALLMDPRSPNRALQWGDRRAELPWRPEHDQILRLLVTNGLAAAVPTPAVWDSGEERYWHFDWDCTQKLLAILTPTMPRPA
jgi:hypothetical protein